MIGSNIYLFVFLMWILMLIGGGILVLVLGPINLSGYGAFNGILSSGIKAIIAIGLVIVWIFVLSKMKKWIFQKQIKS